MIIQLQKQHNIFCRAIKVKMKMCIFQQWNVTSKINKVAAAVIWNQQNSYGTYRYNSSWKSCTTTRYSNIQQQLLLQQRQKSLILLRPRCFGTQRRQRRQPTYLNSNNSNKNQNAEYWDKVYKKSKEQLEQMKGNQNNKVLINEPKSLNDVISWKVLIVMSISPLILCLLIPELRTPMLDSIQQFIPTNRSITIDVESNAVTVSSTDTLQQDTTANNSSSMDSNKNQ